MDKRENGFYWADVHSYNDDVSREVVHFYNGTFYVAGEESFGDCEVMNVSNERVTESKICKGNCKCKNY